MSTNPVFSEVIDVSFDAQAFEASVAQMVELWQKGLEQMSGGSDAIATLGAAGIDTSQISDSITSISSQIKDLGVAIVESFGSVATKVADTTTQSADAAKTAAAEVDQAWSKSSRNQLDELAALSKAGPEAWTAFQTAMFNALSQGADMNQQLLLTQRLVFEELQNNGVTAYELLNAKQQQWAQKMAATYAEVEDVSRNFSGGLVHNWDEAFKQAIVENYEWYKTQKQLINEASNDYTEYAAKKIAIEQRARAEMEATKRQQAEASLLSGQVGVDQLGQFGDDAAQSAGMKVAQMWEQAYAQMTAALKKRAEDAGTIEEQIEAVAQRAIQRQVAMQDQANKEMLASFKEGISQRIAAGQVSQEEIANFSKEEGDLYDAAARKFAAIWEQAYKEKEAREAQAEEETQASLQRQVAMYNQAYREMLQAFQSSIFERITAGKVSEEEIKAFTAEEQEIYDQAARKFVQVWDAAYTEKGDRLMRMLERDKAAEEAAKSGKTNAPGPQEAKDFLTAFGDSFGQQFSGESLGRMAAMQMEWMALGAAIGTVTEAMNGIKDAFASGFEYLSKLEEKAADLQGVIAGNVTLSHDLATNFQLAGEAGTQIAKDLEDASIKFGISSEVLTRGFKSLIDNGGGQLTNSLKESEQVSVLFAAALKGAGKDAEATRSMLSEIPKLMDGTITSSSKILETLNLTTAEWQKIRSEAIQHRDLLPQLQERLQPYIAVAEQAENRHTSIIESLKLWGQRLMAVVDQTIWSQFTDTLKEVKGYFEDHKAQIEAIGKSLGEELAQIVRLVAHMVEWAMHSKIVQATLYLIGGAFVIMDETLNNILRTFTDLGDVSAKFMQLISDPNSWKHPEEAWAKFKNTAANALKDTEQNAKDSAARIKQYFTNTTPDPGKSVLDQPTLGGKNPPAPPVKGSNQPLNDLKAQYEEEAQATKQHYEQERAQIQQNAALRKISTEEANAETQKSYKAEYDAQENLIAQYKKKAEVIAETNKLKPNALDNFDNSVDKKAAQLTTQEQQRVNAEVLKGINEQVKARDNYWKQVEAQTVKGTQEELKTLQQASNAGVMTQTESLDKQLAVIKNAHNIRQVIFVQELAEAGANAERKAAILNAMAQEDAEYTAAIQGNADKRVAENQKEFESEQKVGVARAKAADEAAKAASGSKKMADTQFDAANKVLEAARAHQAYTQSVLAATLQDLAHAEALGITGQKLDELKAKLEQAKGAELAAQQQTDIAKQKAIDTSPVASDAMNVVSDFGDIVDKWGSFNKDFASSLKESMSDMGSFISSLQASVTKITTAFQKGGILGGIGAAASEGGGIVSSLGTAFKDAFSAAPVIGGLLSAAGSLFTSISGLFVAQAQAIAERISKQFNTTMQKYQEGAQTLAQTIKQVEQERADAISQLSGKKGGQEQLDKLLPQLDQEIASLKQQQKQIVTQFEQSLHDLELHNTALAQTYDQWVNINKQITDYLNAGGDAAKAAQFLSDSLAQMKQQAGDQLNQGMQQAVNDAMQLNSLIQQRLDLQKQEAAAEFNIINGDALERRGSYAIQAGTQLQQQRAQYKQQLDSLNQQIDLTQKKLELEKQIFAIGSSNADLWKESEQLQLQVLQEQLQTMQAYQQIYNGIQQNPNGTYSMTGALQQTIGAVNINITVPGGTPAATAQQTADAVVSALNNRARYGMGSAPVRTSN